MSAADARTGTAGRPVTPAAQWYVSLRPPADSGPLLLCLPPAGAGPSSFRDWPAALPAGVGLDVLALPGREARIIESPTFDLGQVVEAVRQRADRPYAMYGHSMGGLLAFEVVRELRRLGARLPSRLYLGGSRPPQLPKTLARIADLPDEEFLARIAELGGLPQGVRDVPELLDLILPALRADFDWLNRYTYRPEAPVPVPLVCLAGTGDRDADPMTMAHWAEHTAVGCTVRTIQGGHLFFAERAEEVAALVGADLLAATGTTTTVRAGTATTTGTATAGATPGPRTPAEERSPGSDPVAEHLIPLGSGGWRVWREGVLRAAGFPADGVLRLTAPELAAVADAHLDGTVTEAELLPVLGAAVAETSKMIYDLAGDPLFREAVTWQNLNALTALDSVRRGGPDERSHDKRRAREQAIGRYWQRYTAKNDTIGFFGPICWATLTRRTPTTSITAGPALVRRRMVAFEWRALAAFGDRIATDPAVRRWLPAGLHAPYRLADERRVSRPAAPAVVLSPAEAAVVARLDGRTPVVEIARHLVAEEPTAQRGLRNDDNIYLLLDRLVDRGLLWWGVSLPMSGAAEGRLREVIEGIGEADLRRPVEADFARLCAARDEVAAAAGDPDRLYRSLRALHADFTELTGQPAMHRPGETYAGRAVCYEDTVRDLDVTLGAAVLDTVAAPLDVLLRAARWLTVAIAEAYGVAFRGLYEELAAEAGDPEVGFADFWYLAQGPLFGTGERPIDAVSARLATRFGRLTGLDDDPTGDTRLVELSAADLATRVDEIFPADRPGWSAGRIHSPDLQICAASVEEIDRGAATVVLGELHTAWSTLDNSVFASGHDAPEQLADWLAADLGPGRVRLLFPPSMPRHTARVTFALQHRTDVQLAFVPAPGADPRCVPITALRVRPVGGELVVDGAGHGPWPLLEVFSELLSMHAADGFKLVTTRSHTPRIVIDRLVAVRETWRTSIDESGLASATGSLGRYLAVRRWRRSLGLPERVYVKLSTETKPCYVDLSSPMFASSLCAMVRAARQQAGGAAAIVVSEALPGPDLAWVPDSQGRRYQSELRIQVVDPALPSTMEVTR
ncbi:surfactin synthase thioesterase subunit [Micromonospora kangleipakensis]|uniref:Surfactin synthase thioesterase subunit n=1 Tax=Micromonospora kangleipakensis TaxID=1077942 RepID=A0A4Q8BGT3_9ACTN|nr:alpha/beta fold hydrolase [Micromonospora kangleipakensis]RZU76665.1 surfactin synthase thioesterase subunit [Micromonospora kangleipakensis]